MSFTNTNPTAFSYVGQELDVFSKAVNWKRYWGSKIRPYLGQRVLEVGAGIGGTTRVLCDERYSQWVGLEPDADMVQYLQQRQAAGEFGPNCAFEVGTIDTLGADKTFDSIIYIDVLEHIEDDAGQLVSAARHVVPGGHIIALSPAYPRLYTEFDKAIGHYRRYTRQSLSALTPPGCRLVKAFYLDAVGLMTSLANLLVLHSPQPTEAQILLWDRWMVPLSRVIDPLIGYSAGRSIICIWQRQS